MPTRNDFKPGEFCWIDLVAHDLDAAVSWYSTLFGWNHFPMPAAPGAPPYAFFLKGEAGVGGIGQMSDEMKAAGIPPMWNSYVATADCAATEAKVIELGGTVTAPTQEVPGHGKLAFFLDPEGASFACWQNTNPDSPGLLVGEPGSLSWNEKMTRDVPGSKSFYRDLVGWEYVPLPMGEIEYTMLKCGEVDAGGMMGMDGPQFEGVPAHWMVYFAVADCAATTAKAESTGGKVLVPPTEIMVGKFSCLQDPQGGAFSIIELNDSAS